MPLKLPWLPLAVATKGRYSHCVYVNVIGLIWTYLLTISPGSIGPDMDMENGDSCAVSLQAIGTSQADPVVYFDFLTSPDTVSSLLPPNEDYP